MGWLFACFGCTNKRKRPNKPSKFGPKSRRIRSYQPLVESDVVQQLESSQAFCNSNSDLREKPKEEKNATRIKKRVRFNLEVTTYKLLPPDDDAITSSVEYEEVTEEEEDDEQRMPKVILGYMPLTKPSSYASNHRYNNCYDDEDEYHDGEDDNDDTEDELSDDDEDEEDEYHEEIPEESHHIISVPLSSSDDGKLATGNGSKINTRFRSHYIVPVLNPIENISQWKTVKARRKC